MPRLRLVSKATLILLAAPAMCRLVAHETDPLKADESVSDAQLLDAMILHPILIHRPIVVTSRGVKLCRPSEVVLDILPMSQKGH
jgi:arsenate reductase-like glutaredoxin family protein